MTLIQSTCLLQGTILLQDAGLLQTTLPASTLFLLVGPPVVMLLIVLIHALKNWDKDVWDSGVKDRDVCDKDTHA